MRALLLLLVPLLLLPAMPAEATSLLPLCTTSLVESVSACVGPGECATLFLGPAATTRCAPPACTAALIESFGVCQDPSTGCVYAWVGPGPSITLVCPRVAAGAGLDACSPTWAIPLTQVQACVAQGSAGTCATVTEDRAPVAQECLASTVLA